MKFFRMVWANLRRKKMRTVLTIGSFAVALFLYGLLAAIRTAFSGNTGVAGADRLDVLNKISMIMPLPYSYRERLLQVPGVAGVTYATWFGGVYQDERNFFPQFAVDKDTWFDIYSEYTVPQAQRQAFLSDRQGCIIGRSLAKRFGFTVGSRTPRGARSGRERGSSMWPGSLTASSPLRTRAACFSATITWRSSGDSSRAASAGML